MPRRVEQHQQRVALAAGEAEVDVARAAVGRRPASPLSTASGTARPDAGHQVVAQRGQPRRARSRCRSTASSTAAAKPAIAGDVEGAGADVALLAAAVQQRR